jgi:hypothetical protein
MMFQSGLTKTARGCGDQRRRDAPGLIGAAFRQAFNPLQRRQIRSPKPSLQNAVSHRRHRRSCGTSPTALGISMSGKAASAMALSAITFSPQPDGCARAAASPVAKACLRFRRSGSTLRPAPFGRSISMTAHSNRDGAIRAQSRYVSDAPRRRRRPSRELVSGACLVQVGKGKGERPRKSGMRYPGMKLHQNRGLPCHGILLIRWRSQLRFDLVLSRRESLGKARNGERPGEDCNGLARQIFHLRDPSPCCCGWSAPFLRMGRATCARLKMSSQALPCQRPWAHSHWQGSSLSSPASASTWPQPWRSDP